MSARRPLLTGARGARLALGAAGLAATLAVALATTAFAPDPLVRARDDAPHIAELERRVLTLSARVALLEREAEGLAGRAAAPARVVAPFEVVDRSGATLLLVTDQPRAQAAAAKRARVMVAPGTVGNYALWFANAGGALALALGEARDQGGVVVLNTEEGRLAAQLNQHAVTLHNAGNNIAAALTAGRGGSGSLQLAAPSGQVVVEAGGTAAGIGVVRVGPGYRCAPAPAALGLQIPDCLVGRKAP